MTGGPSHVGWVGFGAMGRPMVARLVREGHRLHGAPRHDADRAFFDELGITAHDDLAEVAAASDVVFSIVPGPAEVAQVWTGRRGLLEGATAGMIGVDMSTVGTEPVREVAERARERGVVFIDAPVSGGVKAAAAGSLALFAGGEADALDRASPVLSALGTVRHVGASGSGQRMKLVNQALVAANTFGLCLGWALSARAGIDSCDAFDALTRGAADGALLRLEWPMLEADDLRSGFAASHMVKDLGLLQEFCSSVGIGTGVVDALRAEFDTVVAGYEPLTATHALGPALAERATLSKGPRR